MRGPEVGSLLPQPQPTEAAPARACSRALLEGWFADMSCKRSSPYITVRFVTRPVFLPLVLFPSCASSAFSKWKISLILW